MKPYGMHRLDCGCCPGHDKFPRDTYNSRRSKKARSRDKKVMHQIGRTRAKRALRCEIA